MKVLDKILDILLLLWDGLKRLFENPISRKIIILLAIVLADIVFLNVKTKAINRQAEEKISAIEQRYAAELAAARAQTQSSSSTQQYQISEDAEYMAKVVAGCSTYYDENVQRAVAWCVLNRVDSALYPDTIKEVCEQANQWQGYENAAVIDSICELCQSVIDTWKSGGKRDVPQDCLFLRMTADGVELRTDFNGGNVWLVENSSK
ncbi:MAG: cell wall hydrolase [Candidatus Limivicinus sp.]|nr:cell wall hydrolase [Clostridiales bacterium]MDY3859944.1 cell wall hydrolase [Candidatus Limivicinus sp.]